MAEQRISYVDPATITDPRCWPSSIAAAARARRGRKARRSARMCRRRSGRSPIPGATCSATASPITRIKELCRVYVSRSVQCEYCGNQRSIKAAKPGLDRGRLQGPDQFRENRRGTTSGRRRRCLCRGDHLGPASRSTSSGRGCTSISASREIVELGYFVAMTMGQQRWLRTLNIEHHQILAGTDGLDGAGLRDCGGAWPRANPRPIIGPTARASPRPPSNPYRATIGRVAAVPPQRPESSCVAEGYRNIPVANNNGGEARGNVVSGSGFHPRSRFEQALR